MLSNPLDGLPADSVCSLGSMQGARQHGEPRGKGAAVAESMKSDKQSGAGGGKRAIVREPEGVRAVLEKDLHRLYWWVLNACRIKGFVQAKARDEQSRAAGVSPEER